MKKATLKHPFFVLIGPSGSGKTKVADAVFPAKYKVISHTTRPIRKEEQADVDYYFETTEQFAYLIESDSLVEYDTYHGHLYGVGVAELLRKTNEHYAYDVLTIKGFQAIEHYFGSMVIPIFLEVSKKNVLSRLQIREDQQNMINERSALYEQEALNKQNVQKYPTHFVIDANQSFEQVVSEVKKVVEEIVKSN